MGEVQEKVWVVCRWTPKSKNNPIKVFEDRKDARNYANRMRARSVTNMYTVTGVKKG